MKETILQLHHEMEQAIGRLGAETTGKAMTELCYQVTTHYWQRVKETVRRSGFQDDAMEIDFFKNIKPKFMALFEYYLLLFRYQIHAEGGGAVLEQFRQDETERFRKFRESNASFIT